jgi:hypothetical protein
MLYPGVPQSVQNVTGLGRFIKGLLVQHHAQKRSVDLQTAVVFDEAQFSKFVHEKIDSERVVPIISASVSCDILGRTPWGWSCLP